MFLPMGRLPAYNENMASTPGLRRSIIFYHIHNSSESFFTYPRRTSLLPTLGGGETNKENGSPLSISHITKGYSDPNKTFETQTPHTAWSPHGHFCWMRCRWIRSLAYTCRTGVKFGNVACFKGYRDHDRDEPDRFPLLGGRWCECTTASSMRAAVIRGSSPLLMRVLARVS